MSNKNNNHKFGCGDVVVIGMMGVSVDEIGLIIQENDTYMGKTLYSVLIGNEIVRVYDTEIYPLNYNEY